MRHLGIRPPPERQRGVTMIEAMVALLVMSFGMVALVTLLGNLRQNADIAKQRGDAMRIAQTEIANLRSFAVLNNNGDANVVDYDHGVVSAEARIVPVDHSNATFSVTRDVAPLVQDNDGVRANSVSVTVKWKNRYDKEESLRLTTMLARIDPAFSAALSIAPPVDGVRTIEARNPVIPAGSRNMGNGSSVFRPSGSAAVWVFNNSSGVVVGKCQVNANIALSALTLQDLESCSNNTIGYLVAGTIQFSGTNPADPAVPNGVARPVSVLVSLTPSQYKARDASGALSLVSGGTYSTSPTTECFTEGLASTTVTQTFVNYTCLVFPNSQTPPNWWGQVLLSGLDIGTSANQFRVCRYSADYNGNGYTYQVLDATEGTFRIDNEEHPETYRGVSYSLAKQNFLVVRGDVSCPTAHAVDAANGVFVDYSTVQIQPALSSAP